MKITKIITILLFFSFSCTHNLFSEDKYCIKKIDIKDINFDYDFNKNVEEFSKIYLNKKELENFSITDCYQMYLGDARGVIYFIEFSEGKMPFKRDYLIELYFDELNNFIKSEIFCFFDPPQNRMRYPFQIQE